MNNDMGLMFSVGASNTPELMSYRHLILQQLLENKEGMCIENLASHLNITRTATQQHFKILEKEGLIKKCGQVKTNGRPSTCYTLTNAGIDYFPKHYLGFSVLLLQSLKEEMGGDRLAEYLKKLGVKLAQKYLPEFSGKTNSQQLELLASLMRSLGFHAYLNKGTNGQQSEIQAFNCIYHNVARQFPELCGFDLAFIETLLTGTGIKQVKLNTCMARGDGVCCFKMG